MAEYRLHTGNTLTPIFATLKYPDVNGDLAALVLTGLTVKFYLVNAANGATVVAETATGVTVTDENAGTVKYSLGATSTIPAGVYWGYFNVYSGSTFDTYPVAHAGLVIYIDSDTQTAEEALRDSATWVAFPLTLAIGDSYTETAGKSIQVYLRNEHTGAILTAIGTKLFSDGDFAPELVISNGNGSRVRATVTYVDAAEDYLKVEIPSKETRRAAPGAATVQCVLKWAGVQHVLFTRTVHWLPLL